MLVPLSSLEDDDRCRIVQILDSKLEYQFSLYYWSPRTIWLIKREYGTDLIIHLLDDELDLGVNIEQANAILVQVM